MNREFDVVVVGAGIIGSVAASLLAGMRARPRVALIAERWPTAAPLGSDWDLRVYALSRASQRILSACEVWQNLPRERVSAYERMRIWDSSTDAGSSALVIDCAELGEPDLGVIVDGRELQFRCLAAARAVGVTLIEGRLETLSVAASRCRVGLADGRRLEGRLLVGADGADSRTRELLGIESAGHGYHQEALVAHVRTERPHAATAWQRFLPEGPLAFLPLPDGRSSIVWSLPQARAKTLRELSPAAFGDALTAAAGGALGACQLESPLAAFPLNLKYALEYARPHAVLVGDAAHVVHPLAGQGLNLGLLDCLSLVEVLERAAGLEQCGDLGVLRRYERWRRSENLLAATALDGLERVFSVGHPVFTRLRAFGLGAVGRLPPLKRELVRRALGLAGDVPERVR